MDETTDGTVIKVLAILVRYFNEKYLRFETRLFRLKKVVLCTGEELYDQLLLAFDEHKIEFQKECIGFCSENANVMVGVYNSVWSRLKALNNNLMLFGCLCHSLASIGSWFSRKMPSKYEDFTRDVYTHFCLSPKRIGALTEFQEFCENS